MKMKPYTDTEIGDFDADGFVIRAVHRKYAHAKAPQTILIFNAGGCVTGVELSPPDVLSLRQLLIPAVR